MSKTTTAPVTKIESARAIFTTALAAMRKPRGSLKVVNVDLRDSLITSFVDEAGFKPASAKKAFNKLNAELLEAGVIGEAAPEPEPVVKAPKNIDVARGLFNKHIHKLNTTDILAKDFRSGEIAGIQKALPDVNEATACAMYNTCRSDAVTAGLIDEGRLGRKGAPVDRSQPWLKVNVAGDAIAAYATKKAASANLVEGQEVHKTEELEAA